MKRGAPLKRTAFKRKRPEGPTHAREVKPWAKPTVQPLRMGTYAGTTAAPITKADRRKPGTVAEHQHKGRLIELGCMVCRRLFPGFPPGPVELHHLRGGGWGRGDYSTLIPLCVEHHRGDTGVHGLGTKGFPKRYGFDQADLLADARALLGIS